MIEQAICFVVGLLGVYAHAYLSYSGIAKHAKKKKVDLRFIDYMKRDWPGMIFSICGVLAWLLTFGEAANKFPVLITYTRATFFAVGLSGDYIVQKFHSRTKAFVDNIDNLIDKEKE